MAPKKPPRDALPPQACRAAATRRRSGSRTLAMALIHTETFFLDNFALRWVFCDVGDGLHVLARLR